MQESFQEKRRAGALRSNPTWILRTLALVVVIGVSGSVLQALLKPRPKQAPGLTDPAATSPPSGVSTSTSPNGTGYAPTDPKADKLEVKYATDEQIELSLARVGMT